MKSASLTLNKLQWELLCALVRVVVEQCPVEEFELESTTIMELYHRQLHNFTFYKQNKSGNMKITLQLSEAYAINLYWGPRSGQYNVFIRPQLEPQLPSSRPEKEWTEDE
ncbi:MAG TPA: hypothetical protein VJ552_05425 [Sediminibacterium sp.]|nr:hypothetical protein [Sediminibacterium sp.]